MLVSAVAVRVKPNVGQGSAVGILGVSDARYLQPYEPVRQHALRVVTRLLAEAANRLARGHSLGSIHAYEPHGCPAAPYLYRDGVAVCDLGDSAVELIRSAQAVDKPVEAYPGDRIED
jgi:hypothetical protein